MQKIKRRKFELTVEVRPKDGGILSVTDRELARMVRVAASALPDGYSIITIVSIGEGKRP